MSLFAYWVNFLSGFPLFLAKWVPEGPFACVVTALSQDYKQS